MKCYEVDKGIAGNDSKSGLTHTDERLSHHYISHTQQRLLPIALVDAGIKQAKDGIKQPRNSNGRELIFKNKH